MVRALDTLAAGAGRRVQGTGGGGGTAKALPITPEIRARFERRLKKADSDKELKKVIQDAARYGVDWSHMLK